MSGIFWFDSAFCLRAALTLLHFVWQGLLIALLAAVAAAYLHDRSAAGRHRVYAAALLLMLACLPATFAFLGEMRAGAKRPAGDAVAATASSEAVTSSGHVPQSANGAVVVLLAVWTTVLYGLGVAVMFGRMFLALVGVQRLRRLARPITDEEFVASVAANARRFDLRNMPVVAYCDRVAIPALVGLWRPMILLPAVLATGLTPEQVELVVLHEMAHIRRWDNAWIVVQRAVESILFFHPAVWYVSRRLSIERELCCDEMVVGMTTRRSDYAESLLRVAELTASRPVALPMAATMTSARDGNSVLIHRLMRILGVAKSSPAGLLRFWPTLAVALVVVVVVCVLRLGTYAKRATAAEVVLARSLADQKLLTLHWEALEVEREFKSIVTDLASELSEADPSTRVFNPAKEDGLQLDPEGQSLLAELAPEEDETFQRMDSGGLRYLKRVRMQDSCLYCHLSRTGVFDVGTVPITPLKRGDVLAVVSVEIAPGAAEL